MTAVTYQKFSDTFDVFFTKDKSGTWNCWCKVPKLINGTWTGDKSYLVIVDEKLISNIDNLKSETIYFPQPTKGSLVFAWNEDSQIADIRKYVGCGYPDSSYDKRVTAFIDSDSYPSDYKYVCLFCKEDAGKTGGQLKIERNM